MRGLEDDIVGTRFRLLSHPDGWVVMLGNHYISGPYPYWTQAWIDAQERTIHG